MTQAVVNSYTYKPFGQILQQQEAVPQPFKYVGQYGVMAEPNGLYYMRARYYDPSVGRFISEDPLGFGGRDVNLYAYVCSNPITRIDPLGLNDTDVIRGLPRLWPAIVAGGQAVGGAIVGVATSPVTVGAVVVGSVIHVTAGTIADEPAIPKSHVKMTTFMNIVLDFLYCVMRNNGKVIVDNVSITARPKGNGTF